MKHESNVAPYVGAWIETNAFSRYHKSIMSHPTWVRGLKLLITAFWEAVKKSHPTWVRGLKQAGCTSGYYQAASHPTWVRGLKQRFHRFMVEELMVAPYVGAWIETGSRLRSRENDKSHPTWVRGLKLYLCQYSYDSCFVAPYVGAWIETRYSRKAAARFFVAPYVGAWIETSWY